jgi:hypothetical protein
VVDDCVSINSYTSSSACLNHVTEFSSISVARIQLIADWLIVEPPRVKLTILRPLIREDTLLRWEHFDSHPAHLTKRGAFSLDICIRPAEHLKDSSLLTL